MTVKEMHLLTKLERIETRADLAKEKYILNCSIYENPMFNQIHEEYIEFKENNFNKYTTVLDQIDRETESETIWNRLNKWTRIEV